MHFDDELDRLARFEARTADALQSADPVAAFGALRAEAEFGAFFSPTAAHGDGVRIAALLVARLRFERLMNGSHEARRAFEDDPRAFAATFKRYHTSMPMLAATPWEEARAYDAWLRA